MKKKHSLGVVTSLILPLFSIIFMKSDNKGPQNDIILIWSIDVLKKIVQIYLSPIKFPAKG